MRSVAIILWMLLPLAVVAYHLGPGQERSKGDEAAAWLERAAGHVAREEWTEAVEAYEGALTTLPADAVPAQRRARLERARAAMKCSGLPEAHSDLTGLVAELQADPKADPALLRDARATLAGAQYYLTWLMRLEGLPREEWEPEIEAARQNYRLLAEQAVAPAERTQRQEDLQAAIRLARMDLSELQGLPIPEP
jgi:hypothetical protein